MTALLVASVGGHLAQLHRLRHHLVPADEDTVWVTFDSPQSRSMLAGEHVHYLPYIAPRDWRAVLAGARQVPGIIRRHAVDTAYSTGSGIALAVLPTAASLGVRCQYVESAARSNGPSVTGRLLARVPRVRTSTQYASWSSRRWPVTVSVFDDFVAEAVDGPAEVTRVVVSLGTIAGYQFRTLVERLLAVLPPDVDVLWQTGNTEVAGLPVEARPMMPQAELRAAMAAADVVVCHAGVGSALDALECGRSPVLVPRRAARGEHVDDHQALIAAELSGRGLAVMREAPELTWEDLLQAAAIRIRPPARPAGLPEPGGAR